MKFYCKKNIANRDIHHHIDKKKSAEPSPQTVRQLFIWCNDDVNDS